MLKLAEKYGDKPVAELPMLFQRILQNVIRDFYRRQKVRALWTTPVSALFGSENDEDHDPLETLEVESESKTMEPPPDQLARAQVLALIESGFFAALLGGNGRRGSGEDHGLLGGQRKNPLLAGDPCPCRDARKTGDQAMNQQDELAGRIARLLEEGADGVAPAARERLFEARQAALARHRDRAAARELVPAWAGPLSDLTESSIFGVRYLIPVAALVFGLAGVIYLNTGGVSHDMADIDVALLTDELPIDAFLDQGLDSWLKRSPR
jgi:hypothetical protein